MLVVCALSAQAELPDLSEEQAMELAAARDDADYRDAAFFALVENARHWRPPFDDISLRYEPALGQFLREPEAHRGELCLLRGVLQQQWIPPAPVEGVIEWTLRGDDGRPFIVYVVGAQREAERMGEEGRGLSLPSVPDGTEVTVVARFFKRVTVEAQNGEHLRYAAFVGAWPREVRRPSGSAAREAIVMAGPVLLLGFVFLGLLWYIRRQRRDRHAKPARRAARLPAGDDVAGDTTDQQPLPEDLAEAMNELHRRSTS